MTEREKVRKELKAIPRDRMTAKLNRAVLGAMFIAGAGVGAWALEWPWYVVVPLAMVGAHMLSAELVGGSIKFISGTVVDIVRAVMRKNT